MFQRIRSEYEQWEHSSPPHSRSSSQASETRGSKIIPAEQSWPVLASHAARYSDSGDQHQHQRTHREGVKILIKMMTSERKSWSSKMRPVLWLAKTEEKKGWWFKLCKRQLSYNQQLQIVRYEDMCNVLFKWNQRTFFLMENSLFIHFTFSWNPICVLIHFKCFYIVRLELIHIESCSRAWPTIF